MAINEDITGTTNATHRGFSWITEEARRLPSATLAESAHDVAKGVALVLEMIEAADLEEQDRQVRPALSVADRDGLLRYALVSSRMLQGDAWGHIEWLNEHGPGYARRAAPVVNTGAAMPQHQHGTNAVLTQH